VLIQLGLSAPLIRWDGQIEILADDILSEGKKDIVFDFKETLCLTSSGIAMLIKVLKKIQWAKGALYVANITQDIWKLLANAALDKVIQVM